MLVSKKIIFLLSLLFVSNSYSIDAFIFEKQCPLYEVNGEEYKKVGKFEKKDFYKFKNFKQIKKKNYAVIENENQKEFYVNKNCGYQKFDEKPQLEKIFSDDEVEKLNFMSEFDREILNFCGYFGSHPTREQFIEIMSNEKYREDLNYIYEKLNKKIFASSENEESKEEFLLHLSSMLFQTGGFVHSTCGFVRGEKLSGPHYYYRFLDLQKNGFIGKNNIKNCGKKEQNQKSILRNYDVAFFDSSRNSHAKCNNSFVKDLGVRNLIVIMAQIGKIEIAKDYKEQPKFDKIQSFIHKANLNNQEISFKIVYNVDKKSLITIYPIEEK
jgi:hypothetical protein